MEKCQKQGIITMENVQNVPEVYYAHEKNRERYPQVD